MGPLLPKPLSWDTLPAPERRDHHRRKAWSKPATWGTGERHHNLLRCVLEPTWQPPSRSQARVDDDGGGSQRLSPAAGVLGRAAEAQPGALAVLLREEADLGDVVILREQRRARLPHLCPEGAGRLGGLPALTRTTLLKEPMRKGRLPRGCPLSPLSPLSPYAVQGLSISTSPSARTHLRPRNLGFSYITHLGAGWGQSGGNRGYPAGAPGAGCGWGRCCHRRDAASAVISTDRTVTPEPRAATPPARGALQSLPRCPRPATVPTRLG